MVTLSTSQREYAHFPLNMKVFLSGPAGTGKSTIAVERMKYLLAQGVRGDEILVLTPQRTLQEAYRMPLHSAETGPGGDVTLATIGGLARRMVDLFWPLVADPAGFAHPERPPTFLTLETAQYYMAHIVRPLLDQGFFESITIDRNRLYSQILDNLNKSAAIGFPVEEIGPRLEAAWFGDPSQRRVYADAQECATRFRAYCLSHNLLDFSLQLEAFWKYLFSDERVFAYLVQKHRHLIYDNLEEDIPRSHDMLRSWLPEFESALLVYDEAGGFRRFLGADPDSAWSLRDLCQQRHSLHESLVASPKLLALDQAMQSILTPEAEAPQHRLERDGAVSVLLRPGSEHEIPRFYPELLDAIAAETADLLRSGLPPSEVVILAPYLSDALRFSLANRLEALGLPWRSQRPSRPLRDEPASRALLVLAALAHPHWKRRPQKFDVTHALKQAISGMDLVRAQLLTEIVYRQKDLALAPFEGIKTNVQERLTFQYGNRYTRLREWLLAYRGGDPLPLDHFLRLLFGEVLAQPGFGFHTSLDAIRVAGNLVESIRKFRLATESAFEGEAIDIGREYLDMLEDGVIAAQYLESWRQEPPQAVLIAPAYTFLMMNRAVSVQFWMDAGSSGWYERLAQPLTHPYVLSRNWEPGRTWTDADEFLQNQDNLARLVSGLLHRCKERIYLGMSELGESGYEGRGELLKAFQAVFQHMER